MGVAQYVTVLHSELDQVQFSIWLDLSSISVKNRGKEWQSIKKLSPKLNNKFNYHLICIAENGFPAGTATLSQHCSTVENESCTDVSFQRCDNIAVRRCQENATKLLQRHDNIKLWITTEYSGFLPFIETWESNKSI